MNVEAPESLSRRYTCPRAQAQSLVLPASHLSEYKVNPVGTVLVNVPSVVMWYRFESPQLLYTSVPPPTYSIEVAVPPVTGTVISLSWSPVALSAVRT